MKQKINIGEWLIWEQNACPMFLTMTLNAGMGELRKYFGMSLWTTVIIFEDNQGKWLFRPAELKFLGQKMIDFLLCAPYRVAFYTGYQAAEQVLLKKANEIQFLLDLKSFSDDKLVDLFMNFCKSYYRWYKFGWFCEPVQFRGQEILNAFLEQLSENKSVKNDIENTKKALFAVEEDTFSVEILRHLVECAKALGLVLMDNEIARRIGKISNKSDFPNEATRLIFSIAQTDKHNALMNLIDKLKEHSSKFFWKQNNYFATRFITETDVLNELFSAEDFDISNPASSLEKELQHIRKNKKSLLSKKSILLASLPSYYQNLCALVSSIGGSLIDTRKKTIMITNSAFDKILSDVATRTNTEINDCRFLIPQELEYFLSSPDDYQHRLKERKKQFIVCQGDFPLIDELVGDILSRTSESKLNYKALAMVDPFISEGLENDKILEQLNSRLNFFAIQSEAKFERLQGVTIYYDHATPKIQGTVKIIRDPKSESLERGEILVASSTTPDYMNAIRLSKAIITDWGGHTSHAAITSMELKKPCIIGTNYASHVLKNGQKVELNFEEGSIRIL